MSWVSHDNETGNFTFAWKKLLEGQGSNDRDGGGKGRVKALGTPATSTPSTKTIIWPGRSLSVNQPEFPKQINFDSFQRLPSTEPDNGNKFISRHLDLTEKTSTSIETNPFRLPIKTALPTHQTQKRVECIDLQGDTDKKPTPATTNTTNNHTNKTTTTSPTIDAQQRDKEVFKLYGVLPGLSAQQTRHLFRNKTDFYINAISKRNASEAELSDTDSGAPSPTRQRRASVAAAVKATQPARSSLVHAPTVTSTNTPASTSKPQHSVQGEAVVTPQTPATQPQLTPDPTTTKRDRDIAEIKNTLRDKEVYGLSKSDVQRLKDRLVALLMVE